MAPWLPGLRTSLVSPDLDSDKAREKIASIFRKLIDVSISDVALSTTLEQQVWPIISNDEIYTDVFLDEIVKCALSFGLEDERTEVLGSIIASLGTITIRGKLLSRLRKALHRTSNRLTRHLTDNIIWNEICILLRLCLSTSFDSGVQSQLYLPELFHLVTMLANTGSIEVRRMVHRLLVNTIHAICTTFGLEETKLTRLKCLLESLTEPKCESLFNIPSRDGVSISSMQDSNLPVLVATEALAVLLSEITIVAAPTVDLSNVWRSRWLSLVSSTAFQANPAIQPRAFTVMGCLAHEDVDDDLLYQVLVALRSSIARFMDDDDSEMLIAIVTSLTKMMDKLPSASRYGLQLFWLALSLVRLVPIALFNSCALFFEAVTSNIATSVEFSGGRMVSTLLQGRLPLEDIASQLDEIYGIHFTQENFHFALCATLAKGLTHQVTKGTTIKILTTFIQIAGSSITPESTFPKDVSCLPYLGLLLARASTPEEAKETLWLAKWIDADEITTSTNAFSLIDLDVINDKELLLNCAINIVDFQFLDDNVQHVGLRWLTGVAIHRPTVILHL